MAGTVMESLNGRRLAWLCAALLLVQLVCILLGASVAPYAPTSSRTVLGTVCVDRRHEPQRWFQVWSVTGGQNMCDKVDAVEELIESGISSDQVVFAFQSPLRRGGSLLSFTRWQQNLIGVLQLDIDYNEQYEMAPNVTLALDARLGYKNKGDSTEDWTLLAASVEERHLSCDLDTEHRYRYNCDLIPLFELGSLHHDFYLLNLRLPTDMVNQRNVGIGKLGDIYLVVIFQNGSFTKMWLSLKTVFFPLVVALLAWFWRRVRSLRREPALIESMLLALGVSLSVLNLPLEYLTLQFEMSYLRLITDIRQGVFYAVLFSFWVVLAGEHFRICDQSRLAAYWKRLAVVACVCISLVTFNIFERGMQLTNPFRTIWGTRVGASLGVSFIIFASVSASVFFFFLSWRVWRLFSSLDIKRQLMTISSARGPQHDAGIRHRLMVMLLSLYCAGTTVIGFILGLLAEDYCKWDEDIWLPYMSGILTGVYGMWNVYAMTVIYLYAPSHK